MKCSHRKKALKILCDLEKEIEEAGYGEFRISIKMGAHLTCSAFQSIGVLSKKEEKEWIERIEGAAKRSLQTSSIHSPRNLRSRTS